MPDNFAALVPGEGQPIVVREVAYTPPQPEQIVVKNKAVAVNPVDWAMQLLGTKFFNLRFPLVLGTDVAGEVVEVGAQVTLFKPGDRVLGHASGAELSESASAAFQNYVCVSERMACKIPDTMSFEDASVFPLAISTAASGLFQKDFLGLAYPSADVQPPTSTPTPTTTTAAQKTLLIWGGSTSVGCCAIQMVVAAGYDVITTSSPGNFAYMKHLGATGVFDYKSPTIEEDLIAAFEGRVCAGALAISGVVPEERDRVAGLCMTVVARCVGDKFVALTMPPPKNAVEGVQAKFVWGSSLQSNEVSRVIYGDFLPRALANGTFKVAPRVEVFGKGLESIQGALDKLRGGVSLTKLVVSL